MSNVSAGPVLCPYCNNVSDRVDYCSHCMRQLGSYEPWQALHNVVGGRSARFIMPGDGLADLLNGLAIASLLIGLVGAIWLWKRYGTTPESGMFGVTAGDEANWPVRLVALAAGFNGLVWCALLGGVSQTLRNGITLSRQLAERATD